MTTATSVSKQQALSTEPALIVPEQGNFSSIAPFLPSLQFGFSCTGFSPKQRQDMQIIIAEAIAQVSDPDWDDLLVKLNIHKKHSLNVADMGLLLNVTIVPDKVTQVVVGLTTSTCPHMRSLLTEAGERITEALSKYAEAAGLKDAAGNILPFAQVEVNPDTGKPSAKTQYTLKDALVKKLGKLPFDAAVLEYSAAWTTPRGYEKLITLRDHLESAKFAEKYFGQTANPAYRWNAAILLIHTHKIIAGYETMRKLSQTLEPDNFAHFVEVRKAVSDASTAAYNAAFKKYSHFYHAAPVKPQAAAVVQANTMVA